MAIPRVDHNSFVFLNIYKGEMGFYTMKLNKIRLKKIRNIF